MPMDRKQILQAATALGVVGGSAQAAHRVLISLCNPGLGARDVARIVQHDPTLAARVLKVANSAYYGRCGQVASVDQAIVLLGFNAVRGIAASACLDRSIRHGTVSLVQPDAFMAHCLGTALAAEALACRVLPEASSQVLVCGLLHDFGMLVQQRQDPPGMAALASALLHEGADILVLEPRLVQVGHARCAQVLFESWGLPALICEAVACHHDPLSAGDDAARNIAVLVHLGMQVALDAGFTHLLDPRPTSAGREALCAHVGLDTDALLAAGEGLAEKVLLLRNPD